MLPLIRTRRICCCPLSRALIVLLGLLAGCATEPDNKPPVASFTIIPPSGTTETLFEFNGSTSTDPDDELRYLQVRWDWNGDGIWDTLWGTKKARTYQFSLHGNHSVTMEVRDSWGKTATTANAVPVGRTCMARITLSPASGTVDTIFTFNASESTNFDSGTTGLQFRWDWESDEVWDIDWSTEQVQQHSYDEVGSYTVLLEIQNQDAVTDTATAIIIINQPNSAPEASFTITPANGSYSQLFTFDASASTDQQDDDATLQFSWDWDSDGTLDTVWLTTGITTYYFSQPDTHIVTLQVRDSEGFIGSASRQVEVTNSPPVATFTSSPLTGDGYTEFTFDASACTDPDSEPATLTVRWDWEDDGIWDVDWTDEKTATHIFGSAGSYTVDFEIRDPLGLTAQTTSDFVISNSSPIAAFSVTPGEGDITTTFEFDASGCTDPEDDAGSLEVRWDLTGDGTWDTSWSTTKTVNHVYADPGLYEPAVEVRDTAGLSEIHSIKLNVTPRILWRIPLSGRGTAPAIAPDGTIYLGLSTGEVVGIDSTGSIIRHLPASGKILNAPSIGDDGTVYFGSDDGKIYAYAADGSFLWDHTGGSWFRTTPAIADDGTIYAGCDDRILYAMNPNGSLKWTYDASMPTSPDPIIAADGTIYIGTLGGTVHAVNPDSTEKWVLTTGGMPMYLALDAAGYIVSHNAGSLIHIAADGSGYSTEYVNSSSGPSIGPDGTIYLRFGEYVIAHGSWSCNTGIVSSAIPLIASDGIIYSGFDAVSSDGVLLWSLNKQSSVSSSLSNGILYAVSTEHELYALEVTSQELAAGIWPKYRKNLRNTGRK